MAELMCMFLIVWCVSGEEWQVSKVGAYLPGAHEEVVDIVNAFILTDKVPSILSPHVFPLLFLHSHSSHQVMRDWRVNRSNSKVNV